MQRWLYQGNTFLPISSSRLPACSAQAAAVGSSATAGPHITAACLLVSSLLNGPFTRENGAVGAGNSSRVQAPPTADRLRGAGVCGQLRCTVTHASCTAVGIPKSDSLGYAPWKGKSVQQS